MIQRVVYLFLSREANCPESRCYLTSDRSYLESVDKFDAIMFHQRPFSFTDIPGSRRPSQRYIQWMFESPAWSYNYDRTIPEKLNNFFNWSMSYRLDARFTTPYGQLVKKSEHPQGEALVGYIQKFSQENLHLAKKPEYKADAAAFISNCYTKSDRDGVVKKLRDHISIDVYGQCSDQKLVCDRSNDHQCLEMLSTSYKVRSIRLERYSLNYLVYSLS